MKLKQQQLIEYIKEMQNLGYDTQFIIKELEKKGWSKKIIEEHIKHVVKPNEPFQKYEKAIILFGIALTVLLIIWVTSGTNAPIAIVFISFLPTMLSLISVYLLLLKYGKQYLHFMFIVPLFWCALLYVISVNGIAGMKNVEISNVLLLNLLISMVFIIFLNVTRKKIK